MEVIGTQNSRDDHTSAHRSFGSNYFGRSQSRKISIGVMVDSLDKWRPKTTSEHESAMPSNEKNFRKLSSVCDLNDREQAKANCKGNQIDQENNSSPWVCTKTTHPREPTSKDNHYAKPTNDSPIVGSEFHVSKVEIPANQKSVLKLTSDKTKKSNNVYSGVEGAEEGEREGTKELPSKTAHEVSISEREAAKDKVIEPEDRKQVLKLKLWEILGANSSPNKQASQAPEVGVNYLNPELGVNQKCEPVVKPKQNSDTIESDSRSPHHTIKRAVTRSLTRKKVSSNTPKSKTRNVRKSSNTKKSLEKNIFSFNDGQVGKVNDAAAAGSPKSNEKNQGSKVSKVEARKINFLQDLNAGEVQPQSGRSKTTKFAEKTSSLGNSMRSHQNSPPKSRSEFVNPGNINKENGFSLLSTKKRGGKGSKGDSPRFSFSGKIISDEVQPAIEISETIKGANKASLLGTRMRSYQNILLQNNIENKNQEKSSSLLPGKKRGRKGSKDEAHKISSPENNVEEVQPAVYTTEITKNTKRASINGKGTSSYQKSPLENSSKFVSDQEKGSPHHWVQQKDFGASPVKKNMEPHADIQSPMFEFRTPEEAFSPGPLPKAHHEELDDQSPENYSFNSPFKSKPGRFTPDTRTRKSRTSSDTEDSEGSPFAKFGPTRTKKDAEDEMYRSSPEKMDSESSKEGWPTEAMSPDIGSSGNPECVLYPNKRLRSQENFKFQRFNPIIASPEGSEESDGSQGPPEKNEENGLANAISLLALALKRVQNKIKSVTSKKSTEVLMAVAEEVHLQLQYAESQFENDVGKLKSLNKSKRKQLETEFEEQQEQLKVIYQKFKADVSQHLQERNSKVEGLQGQEKELRLFMEKRSMETSQREVLKQLEESIHVQLRDAETRIAAVRKTGREKMLQLKQALGKCLKDGMLG